MMFPWSIVAMAALVLPFLRRGSRTGGDEAAGASVSGVVRLVVGGRQHGDLLPVGGRQALLLSARARRHGPARRGCLGPPGASGTRHIARTRSSGGAGRAAGAMGPASSSARPCSRSRCSRGCPGRSGRGRSRRRSPWPPGSSSASARGDADPTRWPSRRSSPPWAWACSSCYGILAPAENPRRSHRELADTLGRLVPPDARTVHFFNEVDEGLWFYLRGLDLAPVPGTQPRYSPAYDLAAAYQARQTPETLDMLDARREAAEKQALLRWIDDRAPSSFLLIRSSLYDRYVRDLHRPRDPRVPRVRPEPQRAGAPPRGRPHAPRILRSAHSPLTLPVDVHARSA